MNPVRVLHVTPSFYPAVLWGGPIVSTLTLCNSVAALPEITLEVLTTDGAGPHSNERLPPHETHAGLRTFGAGYRVRYAARRMGRDISPELLTRLWPMARAADVIHLTATYSFPTLPTLAVARALHKPVVWSPRGALQARQEWSGAASSKKQAFEHVAARLAPARTVLHTTAPIEARLSQRAIARPAAMIPNAIDIPPDPGPAPTHTAPLKLLFLSRIHPKKGLETLIDAVAHLARRTRAVATHLTVCGAGEPGYVNALKARAHANGLGEQITFAGHVDGAAKEAAFAQADVFVLPSHSENFGLVVAEALVRRRPVITTTALPWDAMVAAGAGFTVPPAQPEALAEALATFAALPAETRAEMGARGRRFVQERFGPEKRAAQMCDLYRTLAAGEMPEAL